MLFSDKLIQLRKKAGWSQEELAQQMNITRQSISKWEGGQSLPDLDKIIRLSNLFKVSTDYLLKDEMEEDTEDNTIPITKTRYVSMNEAKNFLSVKASTSKLIAIATFLCILSPICLFIVSEMSEIPKYGLSENVASTIGLITLVVFLIIAVPIFILSGKKTERYEYLEKEIFSTENGVIEMVTEMKDQYSRKHTMYNIIGTICCLASLIPLFSISMFEDGNELFQIILLCIFFFIVGIGVMFFIITNIVWESYQKLLQEGDYSKNNKELKFNTSPISTIYWSLITAIYLGYSFKTNDWGYSWIIWVVASAIYPIILIIANKVSEHK